MRGFQIKLREAIGGRPLIYAGRQADSILIIDDNPENIFLLERMLQEEKYDVVCATESLTAVEWIGVRKFDVILIDVHMPGMNGFEVGSIIRNSPLNSETPVIYLAAYNDLASISQGFETMGADYVTKPFRKRELLARIKGQVAEGKAGKKFRLYMKELEAGNLYIKQSLEYAVYIQNAILKSCEERRESLPEHFVLSLPRDIISGDFHCIYRTGSKLIAVMMDCTGHGVPGALMSILGVTLCNEIILKEQISQPDEILESLRQKLLQSLGEGHRPDLIRDGMEGAVICFNEETRLLQYSGSYNPLMIMHQQVLVEIRGDRTPIGYCEIDQGFSLHEMNLDRGDMVWLFTDGYTDQFGGEMNKKYMIRRLRNFIQSVSHLPAERQKESFLTNFKDWRGNNEQTDDVLVMGLRF